MKKLHVKHPTAKQLQGKLAEEVAAKFLQSQGLSILQRNFLCKLGEIDLIAQDTTSLVFVEVRFRKSAAFGGALASVTPSKQAKLRRTAEYFLLSYASLPACRFDILALSNNSQGQPQVDNWIQNAF